MGFSEKQVQFKIVGDGYEKMPLILTPENGTVSRAGRHMPCLRFHGRCQYHKETLSGREGRTVDGRGCPPQTQHKWQEIQVVRTGYRDFRAAERTSER